MKTWKQVCNTLILAIYAGLIIGIGGTVYLSVDTMLVGAILFGIGLMTITLFGYALFTGRVSYVVTQPPAYCLQLAVIWVGNLLGTMITASIIRMTRVYENLGRVQDIVTGKLDDNLFSAFWLAFCCGMMMFIAVDSQREDVHANHILKALAVFFPIVTFIMCGFNHVVADMFYISLGGRWSLEAVGYLAVVTLGNAAGAIALSVGKYRLSKLGAQGK